MILEVSALTVGIAFERERETEGEGERDREGVRGGRGKRDR